ncbi:MAG: hypothetical protein R3F49_05775 [Planctomycetota bacterium]
MQQVIGANRLLSAAAVEFLNHLTMENLPDGQGGVVRTARISRLNLQIVDGTGTTNGAPTGLGNLIVGYNEQGHPGGDVRTGSHNIAVGTQDNYSSYGGIVCGDANAIQGPYSSVYGGTLNVASGVYASVFGGESNIAGAHAATVAGGNGNSVLGQHATVSGGCQRLITANCGVVGDGTVRVYDSGWIPVSRNSDYPLTHNLMTTAFSASLWFSETSDGSGRFYGPMPLSWREHNPQRVEGACVSDADNVNITVRTGDDFRIPSFAPGPDGHTIHNSGYIRLVLMAP